MGSIVALTFAVDEVTLTCLKTLVNEGRALSKDDVGKKPALSFCLQYLSRKEAEEKEALQKLKQMAPGDLY